MMNPKPRICIYSYVLLLKKGRILKRVSTKIVEITEGI